MRDKKWYLVFFVLSFLTVTSVGLYFYIPIQKFLSPVYKTLPYPAVIIDGRNLITTREIYQAVDALKIFYESQDYAKIGKRVDFSTVAGKKRLKIKERESLNKMVENKIIEIIAKKEGIYISQEDARNEVQDTMGLEINKMLLNVKAAFGWDLDTFVDQVVIYQMYTQQLFEKYQKEAMQREGYKIAKKAQLELNEERSNFTDLVKKYSDGDSAENEGVLGWFRSEHLIPEVAVAISKMKKGEVSKVIVSPLGFHVVLLEDVKTIDYEIESESSKELDNSESKKNDINKEVELLDDSKVKEFKIKQIFIKDQSFVDWVNEKKREMRVYVFMKDYDWNAEVGEVIFRDPKMQKIEKRLRRIGDGDPSMEEY